MSVSAKAACCLFGLIPRETQEMVFDAPRPGVRVVQGLLWARHLRQHEDGGGDDLRRQRDDPVACTPASGWEKGQVENEVGLVRERFFTPRLRFKTLDELNAWLVDKCITSAKAHRHPELPEQTVWEVFEAETAKACSLCRPVRRIPCSAGIGLEDLPGALRQ